MVEGETDSTTREQALAAYKEKQDQKAIANKEGLFFVSLDDEQVQKAKKKFKLRVKNAPTLRSKNNYTDIALEKPINKSLFDKKQDTPQDGALVHKPQTLDTSGLPDVMANQFQVLIEKLGEGLFSEALTSMATIQQQLSDPSRYSQEQPIDLCFEHYQYLKLNLLEEQKNFDQFKVFCAKDGDLQNKGFREIYKLKKLSSQIMDGKFDPVEGSDGASFKASWQAVMQYLAVQKFKMPIVVKDNEDLVIIKTLLMQNFELGAPLLIEPVFIKKETKVKAFSAMALQTMSTYQKKYSAAGQFPKLGVLHFLASLPELAVNEKDLLNYLLRDGSLQAACNLNQVNSENKTPLTEAILSANTDFIQLFLQNSSSLRVSWTSLIESDQFIKAVKGQFAVPEQTMFNKKVHNQNRRFQFQIDFLQALQSHIDLRISTNNEDGATLARQTSQTIDAFVTKMITPLNFNSSTQTVIPIRVGQFRHNYGIEIETQGTKSFFYLMNFLTKRLRSKKNANSKNDIIATLFQHPILQSGQLIQAMCINLETNKMEALADETKVPDLSKILFSSFVPLHIYQTGSDKDKLSPLATIRHSEFIINEFPSKETNYSYTLKFALLYRPKDKQLHDMILEKMDFQDFQPLQLEIMCLLAQFKGCKHPRFLELFQAKVWLLGQKQPDLRSIIGDDTQKADLSRKFKETYFDAQEAFTKMIIFIGKKLIREHEHKLFSDFFLSIRPFCISLGNQLSRNKFQKKLNHDQSIVVAFMKECFAHYSIECLMPIYATCQNWWIKLKNCLDINRIAKPNEDQVKVTLEQIQITQQLKAENQKKVRNQKDTSCLLGFMKIAPTRIVDQCVELLNKYNLISFHLENYASENQEQLGENSDSGEDSEEDHDGEKLPDKQLTLDYKQQLVSTIIEKTSKEIGQKFINRLAVLCKYKSHMGLLLNNLMRFFSGIDNTKLVDHIKKTKHAMHYQRQIKNMVGKHCLQALTCPMQLQFMKDSLQNDDLVQSACGWIGIEINAYRDACEKALAVLDRECISMLEKSFFKWEIGMPASSPGFSESGADSTSEKRIKVRANCGSSQPEHTFFKELVIMQKFEGFKKLMLEMIEGLDEDELFYFLVKFSKQELITKLEPIKNLCKKYQDYGTIIRIDENKRFGNNPSQTIEPQFLMMEPLLSKIFEKIFIKIGSKDSPYQLYALKKALSKVLVIDNFSYGSSYFSSRMLGKTQVMQPFVAHTFNLLRQKLCGLVSQNQTALNNFLDLVPELEDSDHGEDYHNDNISGDEVKGNTEQEKSSIPNEQRQIMNSCLREGTLLDILVNQVKGLMNSGNMQATADLNDKLKIIPVWEYFIDPIIQLLDQSIFDELSENNLITGKKEYDLTRFVLQMAPEEKLTASLLEKLSFHEEQCIYLQLSPKMRRSPAFKARMVILYYEKYSKRNDDDFDEFWPIYKHIIRTRTFHNELIGRVPYQVLSNENKEREQEKKDCEVMINMLKHVRDDTLPAKNEELTTVYNQHNIELRAQNETMKQKDMADWEEAKYISPNKKAANQHQDELDVTTLPPSVTTVDYAYLDTPGIGNATSHKDSNDDSNDEKKTKKDRKTEKFKKQAEAAKQEALLDQRDKKESAKCCTIF